jgi:recombination protein RecT
MAKRSGEIVGLSANVVHKLDTFDLDLGTANTLVHKPAHGDRGEPIGAYSIARTSYGHHEIEWLDWDDISKVRGVAESRGKSPAWSQWPEEMARKTAIRRLAKRLPLGHDYLISTAIEQSQEDTGSATSVLDIETDGAASRSVEQADKAPTFVEQEPAFDPESDIKE